MKIKIVHMLVKEILASAYELDDLIFKMIREEDACKRDKMKMQATKLVFVIKGLAEQLKVS